MNSRRLMGFTPLAENHLRESLIRSASEGYAPRCSRNGGLGSDEAKRAFGAMMGMKKIDVAAIKAARRG
jgi:hypothetical protein